MGQIQIAIVKDALDSGLVGFLGGKAAYQRQNLLRWNENGCSNVPPLTGTDFSFCGGAIESGGNLLPECKGGTQHGIPACAGTT
ncbi:hypothetical protein D3C75_1249130 [compost metagenome]